MMRSDVEIWIVDDDDAVRDSLAALLAGEGYHARGFASAREFLDFIGDGARGCLISDIRMPGLSGLDLQQRLLESGIRIPIIFITGHADVPMAVRALKGGAFDFLEKPFPNHVLLTCLAEALARSPVGDRERIAGTLARFALLTERERQVMALVVDGFTSKEAARTLGISPRTVDIHRTRVMEKMGADGLADLVRQALLINAEPAASANP
ncbi:response regulator transcription factor [Magnetospirillum sp. SS-4]|uniref:response regulator transcription factor n=1 Tax=Magnetospirillum sp. SS-4 TaxID=2681465 RepID=UPI00137E96E4|nr:response regulator [Magnetospirillum sp. SS-4]CAA7620749.1 Transcriptional regulatory protein FixJ [Magnetospirillum sp. SS-4]